MTPRVTVVVEFADGTKASFDGALTKFDVRPDVVEVEPRDGFRIFEPGPGPTKATLDFDVLEPT